MVKNYSTSKKNSFQLKYYNKQNSLLKQSTVDNILAFSKALQVHSPANNQKLFTLLN
jgi:hypothetical protein